MTRTRLGWLNPATWVQAVSAKARANDEAAIAASWGPRNRRVPSVQWIHCIENIVIRVSGGPAAGAIRAPCQRHAGLPPMVQVFVGKSLRLLGAAAQRKTGLLSQLAPR
jgi:hypothetical protein